VRFVLWLARLASVWMRLLKAGGTPGAHAFGRGQGEPPTRWRSSAGSAAGQVKVALTARGGVAVHGVCTVTGLGAAALTGSSVPAGCCGVGLAARREECLGLVPGHLLL
jgi:hypothetical protein